MLEAESIVSAELAGELYPLVELMGNTVAVSLRLGATPPDIQRPKPEPPVAPEPLPLPCLVSIYQHCQPFDLSNYPTL